MPSLAIKTAPLSDRLNMAPAQLELIRRMCIREDAPDDVLELYLHRCRSIGVDPFDKMIYVIPRKQNVKDARGNWNSEIRWTFQASIDLFRSIAEKSGDYAGQLGPFWSNDGSTWSEVWLDKKPPAVCKVGVLRNSFKEPLWVVGTYEYYVPRNKDGTIDTTAKFWQGEKGAHQLAKCVEELALRKAFPRQLHGVYGDEEMNQAEKPVQKLPAGSSQARQAEPAKLTPPADDAPVDAEFTTPPETPVATNGGFPTPKDCSILAKNRGLSESLYRLTILELFDDGRAWPEKGPSSTALSLEERRRLYNVITERTAVESETPA